MPLSDADKEIVKRTVPKPNNKVQAAAVVRLYVAYPNRHQWTYTGLQGAAVLADDLVGHTLWIKLVDISSSNRGVIWDQEIYDMFGYNQDRVFFHSFELEECLAGFSFADEKEAKKFKQKMDDREKNASKATRSTPFGGSSAAPNGKSHHHHSRLGGFGSLLHGHRSSSAPSVQPQTIIPPRTPEPYSVDSRPSRARGSSVEEADPSWKGLLGELLNMGITEDQLAENAEFIKEYIRQKQATEARAGTDGLDGASSTTRSRQPPPPPPPAPPGGAKLTSLSPQNTGSTTSSKRGPPPAPPAPRRAGRDTQRPTSPPAAPPSPPPPKSPPREPSPPPGPPQPKFRAPPPLADAGKFAHDIKPPARSRATSQSQSLAHPGPPPPPRPGKTPIDNASDYKPSFGVPPPFHSDRLPPVPPSRGPVPPPPPARDSSSSHAPPPLPPKAPGPPPPLPPSQNRSIPAPPPPPLPQASRSVPPPPAPPPPPGVSGGAPPPPPPPPPPLPAGNVPRAPPLPPSSSGPPPPPPLPASSGAPPPPPLPPGHDAGATPAAPLPKPAGGRDDLLASIRGTGGAHGGILKKVKDSEKRDRSAALVPGEAGGGGAGSNAASPSPAGAPEGGLAGALAAALSKRKAKVSTSDDEADEDDW